MIGTKLCLLIALTALNYAGGFASKGGFTVEPQMIIPSLTQSMTLSCSLPRGTAPAIETLLAIQVERQENGARTPVATLVPSAMTDTNTTSVNGRTTIKMFYNSSDLSTAKLDVIIDHPVAFDSGTYACAISSVDRSHLLSKLVHSVNVTFTPLTSLNQVDLAIALLPALTKLQELELQVKSLTQENDVLKRNYSNLQSDFQALNSTSASLCNCKCCGDSPNHGTYNTNKTLIENTTVASIENVKNDLKQDMAGINAVVSKLKSNISALTKDISCFRYIWNQTCGVNGMAVIPTTSTLLATSKTTSKLPLTAGVTAPPRPSVTHRIMAPHQHIYLRELPTNSAVVAPFEFPLQPNSPNGKVNYTISFSLSQDPISQAHKVTLESYKVSGTTFINSFGICLGRMSSSNGSGNSNNIIGKRDSNSPLTPCTCVPTYAQYVPDVGIYVKGSYTDVDPDLHICLFSDWTNPITRKYVYLDHFHTQIESWA